MYVHNDFVCTAKPYGYRSLGLRCLQALSAFGTDFTLLSQLFPGRNRRQCKNKYKKECKANVQRIDQALKGNPDGSAPYEEVLSRLRGDTDGSVRSPGFRV